MSWEDHESKSSAAAGDGERCFDFILHPFNTPASVRERGCAPTENRLIKIDPASAGPKSGWLQRFVRRVQTDLTLAAQRYLLRLNHYILKYPAHL